MNVLVAQPRPRIKAQRQVAIWALAIATLGLVEAAVAPEAAAQQAEPEYVLDGSRIFWFVQITDAHVDTIYPGSDRRMHWACSEGIPTVAPDFAVNTGDLTDSTNGILYGLGPWEDEWVEYRAHLDNAGFTPDFYFDLPGNHDQYGDEDLSYYRQYSMWGAAHDTTQPYWTREFPFGKYFFFGAATTGNDGAQWPADNETFTDWELAELESALDQHGTDADLLFLFGHHDYRNVEHSEDFLDILTPYGLPRFFVHGHEHDHVVSMSDDGVILYRIDAIGQSRRDNFAVWGVDANAVSVGVWDATDAWPAVLITAPVDSNLEGVENPWAPPVPNTCDGAPVRALVFDTEPVDAVQFRWDDGPWWPMAQRRDRPQQWRGYFDARELSVGAHELTVEAQSVDTRSSTIRVHVIEAPCNLGEEDPEYFDDLGLDTAEAPDDMGADIEDAGVLDAFDAAPDRRDDVVDAVGDDSDGDTGTDFGADQSDVSADLADGGTSSLDPEDGCGCLTHPRDANRAPAWLALIALLAVLRSRGRWGRS